MRSLIVLPILALAACGESGAVQNNSTAEVRPAALAPGQWTLRTEVTAFTQTDRTEGKRPVIASSVGTRATETVCVAADRPPVDIFAGAGNDCRADNPYVRNGRISVQMLCTREGLTGNVMVAADGSFTDDSITFDRDVRTAIVGGGDVAMTVHVTGERTGDCTPDADGAAPAANGT